MLYATPNEKRRRKLFREVMLTHDLARKLLALPNAPLALEVNNHTYAGLGDRRSHGAVRIGLLKHYAGNHIVVGNISKLNLNKPNWYITRMLDGGEPVPEEWTW